jgi:holliday junction DNA helicase RuvA
VIGRLTGKVVAQEADGAIVIDVGGVGYEVTIPLGTLGRVRPDDAGNVTLWVYTHVREDALSLFGFSDEMERAAFRVLLGVSNVGPKLATAVLGALPAADLARVVARQDLTAFKGITGVGKKIGERLLLELRDKLPQGIPGGIGVPVASATTRRGSEGEERLRSALTGLGFKPGEADRAIASLGARTDTVPVESLLREALALLSR